LKQQLRNNIYPAQKRNNIYRHFFFSLELFLEQSLLNYTASKFIQILGHEQWGQWYATAPRKHKFKK
jgi:hypothetical protein